MRVAGLDRYGAVGLLHFFWWWALDNAPMGKLDGVADTDIAVGIGWQGDSVNLVRHLVEAGWITGPKEYEGGLLDGRELHDWLDYAGRLQSMRASNRDRQRRHRERVSQLPNGDITPHTTAPTRPDPTDNGRIFKEYERCFGQLLTPMASDLLVELEKEYGADWLAEALEETAKNNVRKLAYTEAILKDWRSRGKGHKKQEPKCNYDYDFPIPAVFQNGDAH